jgi:hypothetical protein
MFARFEEGWAGEKAIFEQALSKKREERKLL